LFEYLKQKEKSKKGTTYPSMTKRKKEQIIYEQNRIFRDYTQNNF